MSTFSTVRDVPFVHCGTSVQPIQSAAVNRLGFRGIDDYRVKVEIEEYPVIKA